MIVKYCRNCWCYLETIKDDTPEVTTVDKTSTLCERCDIESRPHPQSAKTHCKQGHVMDGLHMSGKNKGVRYCKICARLAEARHRERNPGYHTKYKKGKNAT